MDPFTLNNNFYFKPSWNFLSEIRSFDLSSHAFANDPSRGLFILLLLLLVTGAGLFFYIKSGSFFPKKNNINLISKEGAISLNNIFMLTLSFTILLGTVYPLFSGVLLILRFR